MYDTEQQQTVGSLSECEAQSIGGFTLKQSRAQQPKDYG